MSNTDRNLHLLGWVLFLVCAVLFLVAGIRAQDLLLTTGSVLFLVGCLLFLLPLMRQSRRAPRERA